jgi:hypothetical protein
LQPKCWLDSEGDVHAEEKKLVFVASVGNSLSNMLQGSISADIGSRFPNMAICGYLPLLKTGSLEPFLLHSPTSLLSKD